MQLSDRIGRRVKLHDLHVLLSVAHAGSMSKAASLLNTGQPAISRSIADLEHTLGVRLLDRNRQGIAPTAYGRALLDGATIVFDDLRQTMKNIEFLADPTVGELRVGCSVFLATSFVSAVIDRLSRRHPRILFRLVTASMEALPRELIERNVDLLIMRNSSPIEDNRLDYEVLFDESYSVAVGAKNPWTRRRRLDLADLINEPWVLPPAHHATGLIAAEAFRASGLDFPPAAVIAEPAEVRISLLATGRFVSIFPDSTLRFSARYPQLKVLPIKQRLSRIPVGIAILKDRTISPLARLFIDSCRELAKQRAK